MLLDRYGQDGAGPGDSRRQTRRGLEAGAEGEELLREDGVERGPIRDTDVLVRGVGGEAGLTKRDIIEAFTDWKVWWLLGVNICSSVPGMAFAVFLPLVVKVRSALP